MFDRWSFHAIDLTTTTHLHGIPVSAQGGQEYLAGSGRWVEGASSNGNGTNQISIPGGCTSATDTGFFAGEGTGTSCVPGDTITVQGPSANTDSPAVTFIKTLFQVSNLMGRGKVTPDRAPA